MSGLHHPDDANAIANGNPGRQPPRKSGFATVDALRAKFDRRAAQAEDYWQGALLGILKRVQET